MRRILGSRAATIAVAALLGLSACSGDGDARSVGPVPTGPSTTVEQTTTTAPSQATSTTSVRSPSTTRPSTAPAPSTTRPAATPTTAAGAPAEAVVDSGTTSGGPWQLVAQSGGRAGLVCAELRVSSQSGGRVCNEASEQDFNGDDTLRYSGAGNGTFFIGVARPNVARVRMDVRGGTSVERATVAAPFTTAARFVALPLPAGATIRSLTALDSGGNVLTTISINP